MTFYEEWNSILDRNDNDLDYRIAFLNKDHGSDNILRYGTKSQVSLAINTIYKVSFAGLIDAIDDSDLEQILRPKDIPQFSNLDNAILRIPELLEFEDKGFTFNDLGYQIMKATQKGACVKYGENHSKTANLFSLVNINNGPISYVVNSTLGSCLVAVEYENKKDLLKKLLLRDVFIKRFINETKNGVVSYYDMVPFLAESTAVRRRSNVKKLLSFLLEGSEFDVLFKNIIW